VALLEQVPRASVPSIAPLGEYAIELAHAFRQVPVRRANNQMVVVAHQTIGVATPIEARNYVAEHQQELLAIAIVLVDSFAAVAARRYVVKRTVEFNAKGAGHADKTSPVVAIILDLTPIVLGLCICGLCICVFEPVIISSHVHK
jgi:hypothetical protein